MAEFDDILGEPDNGSPHKKKQNNPGQKQPKDRNQQNAGNTTATSSVIQSNYNSIITTITDSTTPIVILFGPASSGKTMALLRMIRYFKNSLGYKIEPDRNFRPSYDEHYQKMCNGLSLMANSQYAPDPTDTISFMLVTILDNGGHPLFQILEAPGEHYFDPEVPNAPFPSYIQRIINTNNRKIWLYFVEQDWMDQSDRNNYASKISEMQALTPNDKIIFLFNKCDKKLGQYNSNGHPNHKLFMDRINQQYPGIFTRYENKGIARFLFGPYNFKYVCFSVGTFSNTTLQNGKPAQIWNVGKDFYCQDILKAIR